MRKVKYMLEQELNNSIAEALELDDGEKINLIVGISGAPVELLTRTKKPYLIVNIADSTAIVGIKVWDRVPEAKVHFEGGSVWSIAVQKSTYENTPQLAFIPGNSTRIDFDKIEDEIAEKIKKKVARIYRAYPPDLAKLFMAVEDTQSPDNQTFRTVFRYVFGLKESADFDSIIEAILNVESQEADLAKALSRVKDLGVFKDDEAFETFKTFCYCPAAKGHHGAFIHGLLIHTTSMLSIIDKLANFYEFSAPLGTRSDDAFLNDVLDFRVVKLICCVHDFYKIDEYIFDDIGTIDYKEAFGEKLFHHDMQMAFKLQQIPGYQDGEDEELVRVVDMVTHGVLRHHGDYSDYKPNKNLKTFDESEIFSIIDLLDSRIVGAIER